MNKLILFNIVLLSTISFTATNKIKSAPSKKCSDLTREHFKQFIDERDDLEKNLKNVLTAFNCKNLTSFISDINNQKHNSKHTYPFLMEESKVIAHGVKPVSYFEDISCSHHDRNDAWEIVMASIYTAKKFPITVYYHLDDKLRETVIQEVTKDDKNYYLGVGFFIHTQDFRKKLKDSIGIDS